MAEIKQEKEVARQHIDEVMLPPLTELPSEKRVRMANNVEVSQRLDDKDQKKLA